MTPFAAVILLVFMWLIASIPGIFVSHILPFPYLWATGGFFLLGISFLVGELIHRTWRWDFPTRIGRWAFGLFAISIPTTLIGSGFLLPLPHSILLPGIGALFVSLLIYARWNGTRQPTIRRWGVSDGFPHRLVQLSDIHLDGFKKPLWLNKLVDRVMDLNPDIVVITGDLLDTTSDRIAHYIPILQRLRPKLGVYVVSGNHDFYTGYTTFATFVSACGFQNIDNTLVQCKGLQIAGLPDESAKHFGIPNKSLTELLAQGDPTLPTVLLRHQPVDIPRAATYPQILLTLSGHTHNGQIFPFGWVVRLRYGRYTYGPNRIGHMLAYTTNGTSGWGPPFRLFQPPEIVIFEG